MLHVSGAYLEQETGNLKWTGQVTVVNFLKHTNIDMQLQLSCTGPEGGRGGQESRETHSRHQLQISILYYRANFGCCAQRKLCQLTSVVFSAVCPVNWTRIASVPVYRG